MMLTGCATSGAPKLQKLPAEYAECFGDLVGVPPPGSMSQAKVFAIIAALKKSELAKSQCGMRLIQYYEGLAR